MRGAGGVLIAMHSRNIYPSGPRSTYIQRQKTAIMATISIVDESSASEPYEKNTSYGALHCHCCTSDTHVYHPPIKSICSTSSGTRCCKITINFHRHFFPLKPQPLLDY